MTEVKAAFDSSTDYKRRLAILTLSPYQQEKTVEYFGTTAYMVKKSRELKRKHGILPVLQGMDHRSRRINEDLRANVQSFYETDEVSRMWPGQKDFVTVRDRDARKQKVRK